MMKKLLQWCLMVLVVSGVPNLGYAQSGGASLAPDELVKSVTNDVLTIVRSDEAIKAGDTTRVIALVDQKVLPHFNFPHMTALAVGRDWRSATPEQQKRLVDAFRTLLVRTYSNSLTQYRDQTIDFKPLRADAADAVVKVQTSVRQAGAQPIGIDYSLEKTDQGWKVFDVLVSGVSLVTNYRGSFGDEIRVGGIDGLIKSLDAKNKSFAAQ
jgi:phospholipid transport system substrate-binding protein